MKEQVIITPIKVRQAGQIVYFQIKLPTNARRIIGIELTERIINYPEPTQAGSGKGKGDDEGLTKGFKRSSVLGEVRLQSCEEANLFYSSYVMVERNLAYGDFSSLHFKPKAFSHQTQALEEPIIVDADSTIIQGMYKDLTANDSDNDPVYIVNVYVWIEKKE